MVTFDFSPFYRSTIGFDRMAQLLESAAQTAELDNGYPPYNIESIGEDHYRVSIAVAGFTRDELSIELRENVLHVKGRKGGTEGEDGRYLHRGIAARSFTRQFRLADYVEVENAWLDNGLLTIELRRELPEAMKPRTIEIGSNTPKTIASKARKMLSTEAKAA